MPLEAQCKPSERYLHAVAYLSDHSIKLWQQNCIRMMAGKGKDNYYYQFISWQKRENEIALITLYAYAEIKLPIKFDCIFQYDNPEQFVLADYMITQSVFEARLPIGYLEKGCKHICVLEFDNAIPDILKRLHFKQHHLLQLPAQDFAVGLCQYADLEAIIKRHKKVAILKQLYGYEYLNYDDEV